MFDQNFEQDVRVPFQTHIAFFKSELHPRLLPSAAISHQCNHYNFITNTLDEDLYPYPTSKKKIINNYPRRKVSEERAIHPTISGWTKHRLNFYIIASQPVIGRFLKDSTKYFKI